MPILRTVITDPAELERRSTPRDDLMVREFEVAPGVLAADDGPFSRWDRRFTTTDGVTVETIDYQLAVPHWGWLVGLLLRRPVRTGLAPDQKPAWCPSDRLGRREANILGLCATLAVVAGFLGGLIGQTITYIAADLGGTTATQANSLTVIRIGAVLTFAATALADQRGRRPLLRACLVIAGLACLVTAIAPDFATVTGSQLVARGLVAGAAYLIPIICAEELPAGSRAYAIGLMALPGGLGVGIVLWFVPFLDAADWAWRLLFVLALPALIVAILTARRLPETARFEHDDHVPAEHAHQHMRPSRLVVLAAGMFFLNIFTAPTQQLQTDYLRNTRGLSSTAVAVFILATNTWGFIGIFAGAKLADRSSRRRAATIGLLGLAIGNTAMFCIGGPPMWVASLVGSMVGAAVVPSLGALLPELFPTLRRGAANGLLNGAAVIGSMTGLYVVGQVVTDGIYGPTVAALALGPLIVAGLVWRLPETAGIELEALNPDD